MKTTTQLRLLGGFLLLFMLWFIGTYNLTNPLVAVVIFGFAVGFEAFIVRPSGKKTSAVPEPMTASTIIIPRQAIQVQPVAPSNCESNNRANSEASHGAPQHEDEVWALAMAELEGDERRAGLWAKSFAVANGDEVKAKAAYLRERVPQLADEAAIQRRSAALQQAVATQEVLDRIDNARKCVIVGKGSTREDIAFLARASSVDASLISLTDRNRGDTLLHSCARYGFHDEAMILLRNGANPNAGNGNGQKPFALAAPGTALRHTLSKAAEEVAAN